MDTRLTGMYYYHTNIHTYTHTATAHIKVLLDPGRCDAAALPPLPKIPGAVSTTTSSVTLANVTLMLGQTAGNVIP